MRKRASIVYLMIIFTIICLVGCGSMETKKDSTSADNEVKRDSEELNNEDKNELVVGGIVLEASDTQYNIRLLGYGVNKYEQNLVVDKVGTDFVKGDEILVVLEKEVELVNDEEKVVSFDTIDDFGAYLKQQKCLLYVGEALEVKKYENDYTFVGKITAINGGMYKEGQEQTGSDFSVKPNEDEPEAGFFYVSTTMGDFSLGLDSSVKITYNRDTFEVLSVELAY